MKKIYQCPRTSFYAIMGHSLICQSIKVDNTNKVEDSNAIGFTKGDNSSWSNIWEE